jgi:hypothetical protein
MRALKPITIMRTDLATGEVYSDDNTNKYDYEADTYVNRLAFGDFSNSDPDIRKAVFRLDCNDFSAELKLNLVERVKAGSVSRDQVASLKMVKNEHENGGRDGRDGRDAILGNNIFPKYRYRCNINRCNFQTGKRFDYRWHMQNAHGREWDDTSQTPNELR